MAQPQHNETHKTGNRSEKRSTKAYLRKDGRQQKPETKIVDGIKKNVKCVQTKGAFGNVKH